jgi:hypothetical protein
MRNITVRKSPLHEPHDSKDLKGKSPQQLIGMMWQPALNALGVQGKS